MDAVMKRFLDTLALRSLDVQKQARSLAKRTVEKNLVRDILISDLGSYVTQIIIGQRLTDVERGQKKREDVEIFVRCLVREVIQLLIKALEDHPLECKEPIHLDEFLETGLKSVQDYAVELVELVSIATDIGLDLKINPNAFYVVEISLSCPKITEKTSREPYVAIRLMERIRGTGLPNLSLYELIGDSYRLFTPRGPYKGKKI